MLTRPSSVQAPRRKKKRALLRSRCLVFLKCYVNYLVCKIPILVDAGMNTLTLLYFHAKKTSLLSKTGNHSSYTIRTCRPLVGIVVTWRSPFYARHVAPNRLATPNTATLSTFHPKQLSVRAHAKADHSALKDPAKSVGSW